MAPTQGAPVVRLSTDGERRSMRPINARSETTGTARRPSPLIAADGSPLLVFAGRVHAGGGRQLAQLGLRPMRRRLVAIGRVGASGTAGKPPQAQSGSLPSLRHHSCYLVSRERQKQPEVLPLLGRTLLRRLLRSPRDRFRFFRLVSQGKRTPPPVRAKP
jgi:hypothetical protein